MRSFVKAVAVAAVMAAPAFAFAQSDSGVTRAQVQHDLRQVEAAGYTPESDHTSYPSGIQGAENRVARQNGAMNGATQDDQAYGGVANGTSASGMRMMMPPLDNGGTKPTYFGH
jgi:hypothetical protein